MQDTYTSHSLWFTWKSTGLAGGARKGQNMAHLGHINGQCNVMYFDLPWPLLPTVSNFYGLKRFYSFGTNTEDIFLFECPSLLCFFLQKLYCCQIILYSVKTLDYNKARSISEKYIIWLVLMPWMCAFSCDSPIHEPACMRVRISCKQKGFFPVCVGMWVQVV